MTTIAYRDGVMAADTGAWAGGACHPWADKIAIAADGSLYGAAGPAGACEEFLQWVRSGGRGDMPMPPGDLKEPGMSLFIVLVARPGEPGVEVVTCFGVERYRRAQYYAIGAGAEVAYGAMWAGATATEAIGAALVHGQGANGSVQSIRFPKVAA